MKFNPTLLKIYFFAFFVIVCCAITIIPIIYNPEVRANNPLNVYHATVNSVETLPSKTQGMSNFAINVTIDDGEDKGKQLIIEHSVIDNSPLTQKIDVQDSVFLFRSASDASSNYYIADKNRLPQISIILAFFGLLVFVVTGRKGLASIIGLVFSFCFLIFAIIPLIIAGYNVYFVSLIGVLTASIITIYLGHGLNARASVALISTMGVLMLAFVMAYVFTRFVGVSGVGTEEGYSVSQNGLLSKVNLQGLFLAGIMISTLGVLDDITTAQAASVEEIARANPTYGFEELFKSGLSIGKEHVISLVNTLAFAYIGTSLVTFLLLTVNRNTPFWYITNNQYFAEQAVQTVVGSSAIVLAVPITTALASRYFSRHKPNPHASSTVHYHSH